jgi:hypothetical protein
VSVELHLRGVAFHEAGHALVCRLVGVKVVTVTIRWSGTSHGALVHGASPSPENLLLILLAGDAAVAHAGRLGRLDEGAEQTPRAGSIAAGEGPGLFEPRGAEYAELVAEDERRGVRVTSDAENIAAVLEQLLPGDPDGQERALKVAREWVDAAVEQHWPAIDLVSSALLRETTLSGAELRRITGRLPRGFRVSRLARRHED